MLYRSPARSAPSRIGALAHSVERALAIDFGLGSLAFCTAVYAACAALLLWPGVFFSGVFLNDAFIYADAGYRLAFGQPPGLGATNALGFFAYAPYALAFRLIHNTIEAIPLSFVIFGTIIGVLASFIALTRLSAVIGTLVVIACAVVMLAPHVIGHEVPGDVMTTAANSYNRFGFLTVLLAALLTIEPHTPRSRLWRSGDLVWAVAATMLTYYTKMPFGFGVVGLVSFWLVVIRRDLLGILILVAGCVAVAFAIEAIWPGLNAAYIHEMQFASRANDGGALVPAVLIGTVTHTVPEMLAYAVAPLVALFLVRRAGWQDVVLTLLLLGGSFFLLSQSSQGMVLVTPVAIAVIAVMRLSNPDGSSTQRLALWVGLIAVAGGFAALVAPAAASLVRHERWAIHATPIPGMPVTFRSLRVIDDSDIAALDTAFTAGSGGAEGFAAARTRDQRFTLNALREGEYAHTVTKLAEAHELCGSERDRTAVLDFADVSESLFGHAPVGGWSYLHWGRSFSANAFVAPERLFAGVGCLFDPKLPQNPPSHTGIWAVYGDYLRTHYRLAGETPFWRVLVIVPAPPPSATNKGHS